MEPTSLELTSIKTVVDALKWAQLKPDAIASLVEAMGAEDTDHVRVLAGMADAGWTKLMESWKIANKEATPAQRSKAGVARGAAFLAATGLRLPVAGVAAGPVPVVKNVMNKFKLSP